MAPYPLLGGSSLSTLVMTTFLSGLNVITLVNGLLLLTVTDLRLKSRSPARAEKQSSLLERESIP